MLKLNLKISVKNILIQILNYFLKAAIILFLSTLKVFTKYFSYIYLLIFWRNSKNSVLIQVLPNLLMNFFVFKNNLEILCESFRTENIKKIFRKKLLQIKTRNKILNYRFEFDHEKIIWGMNCSR